MGRCRLWRHSGNSCVQKTCVQQKVELGLLRRKKGHLMLSKSRSIRASTSVTRGNHTMIQCLLGLSPSEMTAKASFWKDGDPWYSHPVYARYWRHYRQAMAWMQSHHHAYRKAVDSYFSALWAPSPEAFPFGYGYPQSSYDHRSAPQDYHHTYPRLKGPGKRPRDSHRVHASTREQQASSEEEETDESDGEVECDLSNMEITEELRQYFAETERHREERRRQQQLDAKRLEDYVYADHDLYYNTHRSVEPPSERPGERRQAEMKRLYGASAAKIQAMEAAVQLNFNKHCDRKRPKYWPVIPLKF